jgi:hypothetical protein
VAAHADFLKGRERWSVGTAEEKALSLQHAFWTAVSRDIPFLDPVVTRLRNRVEKDNATAKGLPFDSTLKPTDTRFIGRQSDAVRDCASFLSAVVFSLMLIFLLQLLLHVTEATAVLWDFFEAEAVTNNDLFGTASFLFQMMVASELTLHYVRQMATYACRFTLAASDVKILLELGKDYMWMLRMFDWKRGANEVQLGIVMPNILNKVRYSFVCPRPSALSPSCSHSRKFTSKLRSERTKSWASAWRVRVNHLSVVTHSRGLCSAI